MFNNNTTNKTPVIAIGLDSGDGVLIEKWINEGHLQNFRKLQQEGTYGRLHHTVNYCGMPESVTSTGILWSAFITGCGANKTGYWDIIKYDPQRYDIYDPITSSDSYHNYPPFYALGEQSKVAVFDQPYTHLCDRVNGVQILGWGGHFPYTESASHPPQLLSQITQKYGKNPVLYNDSGMWWDKKYINWQKQALKESIASRTAICKDLLHRESWDLFLINFPEAHTVGHDLYAFSDPEHPLYDYLTGGKNDVDPVLEVYKQIDRAIGEILSEVGDRAYILCFSPHGIGLNFSDMLSQTFLPEILYRYNFPGKVAIAPGKLGVAPPPMITKPVRNSWAGNVWVNLYEPNPMKKFIKTWTHKSFLKSNQYGLRSPYSQEAIEKPMAWMPSMWFQPLWPKMKAFALPAFADGSIRINLKGRERDGIVTNSEYETICDELTQILYRLQDARTGKPVVKKVVRTRRYATEDDPKLPSSDLIVLWQEQMTDVIDSPDFGRIGPVIYFRAGSHWERGFFTIKGPGITPGSHLPQGDIVDLPATILRLMGLPIPEYFDGKPLVNNLALHEINA